ncbi:hypothetical protein K1719_003105 [Acacia pycnantha]|nr:hypothetical protein K1719_003105 [Acacia pycnantha]
MCSKSQKLFFLLADESLFIPPHLRRTSICPPSPTVIAACRTQKLDLGYSDVNELGHCEHELKENCLILPPAKYKIPLRWPTGRDVFWVANVKITAQEVLSSGSLTKRMMMLDEEQISFRSASLMFDGVEDYSHQIAEMIGLRNESNFIQAGVRTILDIGCGYGSFGAHLFNSHLLTMCIAEYEPSGSQCGKLFYLMASLSLNGYNSPVAGNAIVNLLAKLSTNELHTLQVDFSAEVRPQLETCKEDLPMMVDDNEEPLSSYNLNLADSD